MTQWSASRKEAEDRVAQTEKTGATSLDLSGLALAALPESIGNLTALTSLDLSGNELPALPDSIGNLTALTSLDLNRNRLAALPDSIGNLTALTSLHLSGTGLAVLPESIGNLAALTSLYLSDNYLTALPDSIGNLTALTSLYLSDNDLTALPESIGNLNTLTALGLGNNVLTALPEWIGDLAGLISLDLSANELTALPDSIGNLTTLTRLELSSNSLTALPEWIGNFTALIALGLSRNELTALPDWIGNYRTLTHLYLSGNRLTALPDSIGNLTTLTNLYLSDNELTALPESIGNLAALARLELDHNQLTALPESIGNLATLTSLDLGSNPLVSPPPEVVAGGIEAILAYLRASQRGSTRQWVAKLLIVGEGGAGKTSLVKALGGLQYDPREPTTHGMRISKISMDHPSEDGVAMALSTWDFGGQEIYHATHQFFLTDQSLFLLVWNPRVGYVQSRIRYWLDIITARAPQAKILLVASHGDERRPSDLPLPDLRLAYPNIVASLTIDSGSRNGIPDLLAQVAEQAAGIPNMGRPWPDEWKAAATRLTDDSRSHVRDAEMRWIMAQAGVRDPDEQHQLAELLHQQGAILRHDGPGHGADVVVLQPEWLNTRISRILDSPIVATRTGLLTGADRDREWADVDADLREHFLDMMQRYDLSYRITEQTGPADQAAVAIVVELLPPQAPDYQKLWNQAGDRPGHRELRVRYELGVMPPGIPTWFIAREHRFSTGLHWRTGVLLRDRTDLHLALLRADPEDKSVELAVRGPVPQGFLEVLDDGLTLLLDRYPGLSVRRRIPCPHPVLGGCPAYFEYSRLLKRLAHGCDDDDCDEFHRIPIQTLLAGTAPTARDTSTFTEDALRRIFAEELGTSQRATLKAIRAMQRTHCPSLFTLTPSAKRRPGRTVHILRLHCEEPDAWHALPGDNGTYEITELDAWLAKYGPTAARVLALIAKALPVAGAAVGIGAHFLDGQLRQDMEHTRALLGHKIPPHLGMLDDPDPRRILMPEQPEQLRARAERDADFRDLEAMLLTLDPNKHWGGLDRTITPEGTTLYLCEKHAQSYH